MRLSPIAARIPPELFEFICNALRPPDSFWETDNDADATKREIAYFASVNKYWAKLCQEKLFNTINLRSHADVMQLQEFLNTPSCKIGWYIREFIVEFTTPEAFPTVPWLHLLPPLWASGKLRYRQNIGITLHGPFPDKRKPKVLRSIHWALPRTNPTFSSELVRLNLKAIQFKRFVDLIHFVSELRNLRSLECRDVKWGDVGAEAQPQGQGQEAGMVAPPLKALRKLRMTTIEMRECAADAMALALVVGIHRIEDARFSRTDYGHLVATACALYACVQGDAKWEKSSVEVRNWSIYDLETDELRACYYVTCRGEIDDQERYAPQLVYAMGRAQSFEPHLVAIAPAISVHFPPDYFNHSSHSDECDWEALDEHLSGVSMIERVTLAFATKEDAAQFLQTVAETRLPRLIASNKLCYVLRKSDFQGVSRKPDLEGLRMEDLKALVRPATDGGPLPEPEAAAPPTED